MDSSSYNTDQPTFQLLQAASDTMATQRIPGGQTPSSMHIPEGNVITLTSGSEALTNMIGQTVDIMQPGKPHDGTSSYALNPVDSNGQTSYALVDLRNSNKALQFPEGVQVINLCTNQQFGSTSPHHNSIALMSDSNEEPLYVNAKQYHRIIKRRQARAKLEASGKISKHRSKYLYESRHKHALNRKRGEGGKYSKSASKPKPKKDNAENTYIHVVGDNQPMTAEQVLRSLAGQIE